jgi:glyoxylase-like metal-dependent hydrolase (beta-lactamase superfamily II)
MAHYTITPLRGGSFAEAETSLLYYLADDRNAGLKIPAVYWMFLVHGEGVCFLVDTGPGDPETWQQYHHAFERAPDEEPAHALASVGVSPDDVQVVINTHLHWDHCNGNHLFSKAEIRVQAREIIEAMDPLPAQRAFYSPMHADPPWARVIQRTRPVRGDYELVPGVTLLSFPSHTEGSQGVLVSTRVGPILIAGDVLPYFDNWHGRWGFEHIPSGIFAASLRDYYACFERIEALAPAVVLPGVDPRIAEQASYG